MPQFCSFRSYKWHASVIFACDIFSTFQLGTKTHKNFSIRVQTLVEFSSTRNELNNQIHLLQSKPVVIFADNAVIAVCNCLFYRSIDYLLDEMFQGCFNFCNEYILHKLAKYLWEREKNKSVIGFNFSITCDAKDDIWHKGSFTTYVDKILAFFDHLPPCVDIFYGMNV